MRVQFWRNYPPVLDAGDDDVAEAQGVREATLTKLLTQHRIRRVDAAMLCGRLRTPAVRVASGAAEAAIAHGRLVTERLALVNRQLDHACRHLDRLVRQLTEAAPADALTASAEAEPASSNTPADATILLSLPGIGTDVLATLLAERRGRAAAAKLPRAALPLRGSAGHPACREEPARGAPPGRSRPPARRRLSLSSRRHLTRSGQPRQVSGAAQARSRTRLAPYAQWPTVCSTSPAPCSATASASTRIVPGPPPRGRRDARSGGRVCRSTVTAASTGHPVIARASLERGRRKHDNGACNMVESPFHLAGTTLGPPAATEASGSCQVVGITRGVSRPRAARIRIDADRRAP